MGSGQKRPLMMDGFKRFGSIRKAAVYIKDVEREPAKLATISTNIWKVINKPNHSAYGHTFRDDVFLGMTPDEYESIISTQRKALEKQHQLILYSRKHNMPLNQKAVLTSQKLLEECGVEA